MHVSEVIHNLIFEYYGIEAANPEWDMTMWDFLVSRGCTPEDIEKYTTYEPNEGEE